MADYKTCCNVSGCLCPQVTAFRFEGDVQGSELQLERFEVRADGLASVRT